MHPEDKKLATERCDRVKFKQTEILDMELLKYFAIAGDRGWWGGALKPELEHLPNPDIRAEDTQVSGFRFQCANLDLII